mgnify:CR=1 FL=1
MTYHTYQKAITTQSTKSVPVKATPPCGFNFATGIASFLFLFWTSISFAIDNQGYCQTALEGPGLPKSSSKWIDIQCRDAMALSFDEHRKVPNWVQHSISIDSITGKANRKHIGFKRDIFLKNSPAPTDYTRSGYDRGHLAPAADFKSNQDHMSQSFWMSNIAPQVGHGFNRNIWRLLEEYLRQRVRQKNAQATIITGTLFDQDQPLKIIGEAKIAVPNYFYKIYLNPEKQVALAFLMANKSHSLVKAPQTLARFKDFQVSIDQLEELTGLDFFCNLPDDLEKRLEANIHQEKDDDIVGP